MMASAFLVPDERHAESRRPKPAANLFPYRPLPVTGRPPIVRFREPASYLEHDAYHLCELFGSSNLAAKLTFAWTQSLEPLAIANNPTKPP